MTKLKMLPEGVKPSNYSKHTAIRSTLSCGLKITGFRNQANSPIRTARLLTLGLHVLADSSFGGCVLVQTWKWLHNLSSSPQPSPQLLSHLPGTWGCSVQMKNMER